MRKRGNIRLVVTVFMAVAIALFLPGLGMAGSLEPSGPPAPTMRTLDEIYSAKSWSKKLPCDSQTNCPRFEVLADFNNEAVLDKETGIVWEKSAWRYTPLWIYAIELLCTDLELGGRKGWRLPTVEELTSLVDPTQDFPALPNGHPFVNVYEGSFWSATTEVSDTSSARCVFMGGNGAVGNCYKTGPFDHGVWCVRGGQGYDAY
jgi:hypothetical protein